MTYPWQPPAPVKKQRNLLPLIIFLIACLCIIALAVSYHPGYQNKDVSAPVTTSTPVATSMLPFESAPSVTYASVPTVAPVTVNPDTLADTAFLETLRKGGGLSKDWSAPSQTIINAGKAVCDLRRNGESEMGVTIDIRNNVPQLSVYQSGFFVGAAEGVYCPEER